MTTLKRIETYREGIDLLRKMDRDVKYDLGEFSPVKAEIMDKLVKESGLDYENVYMDRVKIKLP